MFETTSTHATCDLASLIADLCFSDKPWGETYNIGSGEGRTEEEIVALVEQTLERKLLIRYQPGRPFDVPYAVLDICKAKQELGWRSKTPLSESILRIREGMSDPRILE